MKSASIPFRVLSALDSYTQNLVSLRWSKARPDCSYPVSHPVRELRMLQNVSRELLAGNAGDSPRRTQFGGFEVISQDSHLFKVETTSRT